MSSAEKRTGGVEAEGPQEVRTRQNGKGNPEAGGKNVSASSKNDSRPRKSKKLDKKSNYE